MLTGSGLTGDDFLKRLHERDAVTGQTCPARQVEQDRCAWISLVHPVPESRESFAARARFVYKSGGYFLQREALSLRARHRARDHFHAAGTRAAVLVANGEQPRGDGRREGLTITRRRQSCRGTRRRA